MKKPSISSRVVLRGEGEKLRYATIRDITVHVQANIERYHVI